MNRNQLCDHCSERPADHRVPYPEPGTGRDLIFYLCPICAREAVGMMVAYGGGRRYE